MAGYPPDPPYGMNYGEQSNNYMPSFDQQQMDLTNRRVASNPNYPPPNAPESFAAYNLANAQYNANLPAFATPSFFPTPYAPPPSAPSFQMPQAAAWNTSAGMPANTMSWQQQSFNSPQPPMAQYGLPSLDTNSQQQMPQHMVHVGAQPVEEGELSEGEFQDNFGAKMSNSGADANNNMSGSYYRPESNGYRFNASPQENAYRDSPRSAVPLNSRRSGRSFSRRRRDLSSPRQHQSDNYSPYGSPRQHNDTRGTRRNREAYAQRSPSPEVARNFHHAPELAVSPTVRATNVLPTRPLSVENEENMAVNQSTNDDAENLHDIPDDDRYSPELERSSTPDKRTLAQHAILNLMAAKVQFQDYIQEGIDETLMHGLFESLGMPQTKSKAVTDGAVSTPRISTNDHSNGYENRNTNSTNFQSNQPESSGSSGNLKLNGTSDKFSNGKSNTNGETVGRGQQVSRSQHGLESTELPLNSTAPSSATTAVVPNGEERKDKIARLLAETQKKKASATSPSTDSSVPNVSNQAAKLKAEKDRLLSIKIENLRKSREARILKNEAANKVPITPVSAEAKSMESTPISPSQHSSQIPAKPVQPQPTEVSQPPLTSHVSAGTVSQSGAQLASNQKTDIGTTVPLLAAPAPKETPVSEPALAIPGLFLSSTGAVISPNANGSRPNPAPSHRKRPVAADFDEPMPTTSYKRPFGQSRIEKPLVIDVSDDESSDGDEGSAMDLDQPESSHGSTGPAPDISFSKASATTRSQHAEPETRHSVAPVSISVQPAQIAQSPAKPPPDVLKSKLDQIAELHKKIAEAEAKKKAKASANRSGSQTPLTAEVANAQQNMVNEAIAEKNKASAELERLLEGADAQIASDTQKLADTAAKEQEKAAEIKQREMERKRKRRSEIQLVDAEVEKNQQKLEKLRAEMAKAEAAIQKSLEDKQKLESELAKLDDESDEGLQTEQTQQLDLPMRDAQSNNATPQGVDDPAQEDCAPVISSSDAESNSQPTSNNATTQSMRQNAQFQGQDLLSTQGEQNWQKKINDLVSRRASPPKSSALSLENGISQEKQATSTEVISPLPTEDVDMSNALYHQEQPNDTPEADSNPNILGEPVLSISNEHHEPSTIPNAEKDMEDAVQNSNSHHVTDETVIAHSPISVSADQVLEAALQQASAQAEEESRGSQTSDIEMGNTYAPDPSQLEPDSPSNHYTSEGEVHEISGAQVHAHGSPVQVEEAADEESDAYEPPEATPPAFLGNESPVPNSPPFSPAPPELMTESIGASEMSTTNLETANSIEPLGSKGIIHDQEMPISVIATEGEDHSGSNPTTFFTPYESPLKRFSSYRFNKNFSDDISGGFRSISYSHKIDPMKPICRYELGGTCNDPNCELQHFKDLNLADDMILLQLGDSETCQPELKDSFVAGLKSVLQDLRDRKTRDFSTIASEIAAFRAKFNAETLVL